MPEKTEQETIDTLTTIRTIAQEVQGDLNLFADGLEKVLPLPDGKQKDFVVLLAFLKKQFLQMHLIASHADNVKNSLEGETQCKDKLLN